MNHINTYKRILMVKRGSNFSDRINEYSALLKRYNLYKYKTDEPSYRDLRKTMKSYAEVVIVVLDSNYDDIEAIEDIAEKAVNNESRIVAYCPRPNNYLEYQKCVIYAFCPRGLSLPFIGYFAGLIQYKARQYLRKVLRGRLLMLAYNAYKKLSGASAFTHSDSISVTHQYIKGLVKGLPIPFIKKGTVSYSATRKQDMKYLVDNVESYSSAPRIIHVALLNQCNLRCIMCPYHGERERKNHKTDYFYHKEIMEEDVYRKILEYSGRNKVSLQFGEFDEPMLHPRFIEILKEARQRKIPSLHVTTNGTLLRKTLSDEIASYGIDSIMVSLDAMDAETYKRIRGGNYQRVCDDTCYLFSKLPYAKKVVSIIEQENVDSEYISAFVDLWISSGADTVTVYKLYGSEIEDNYTYELPDRYPCGVPWRAAFVYPDGKVTPCCTTLAEVAYSDKISMGSLKNESFDRIWMGDRYSKLRRELMTSQYSEFKCCEKCNAWSQSTYFEKKDNAGHKILYNMTTSVYSR